MSVGSGDRLARGAKSATFSAGNTATQIAWDHMWMDGREFKKTYGITKTQFANLRDKVDAKEKK